MFESVVLLVAACFRPVIGDLQHLEVGYGLVFLGVGPKAFDVWVLHGGLELRPSMIVSFLVVVLEGLVC